MDSEELSFDSDEEIVLFQGKGLNSEDRTPSPPFTNENQSSSSPKIGFSNFLEDQKQSFELIDKFEPKKQQPYYSQKYSNYNTNISNLAPLNGKKHVSIKNKYEIPIPEALPFIERCLYVGNTQDIKPETLALLFDKFGPILLVESRAAQGYAFIYFENLDSINKALESPPITLSGRQLTIASRKPTGAPVPDILLERSTKAPHNRSPVLQPIPLFTNDATITSSTTTTITSTATNQAVTPLPRKKLSIVDPETGKELFESEKPVKKVLQIVDPNTGKAVEASKSESAVKNESPASPQSLSPVKTQKKVIPIIDPNSGTTVVQPSSIPPNSPNTPTIAKRIPIIHPETGEDVTGSTNKLSSTKSDGFENINYANNNTTIVQRKRKGLPIINPETGQGVNYIPIINPETKKPVVLDTKVNTTVSPSTQAQQKRTIDIIDPKTGQKLQI